VAGHDAVSQPQVTDALLSSETVVPQRPLPSGLIRTYNVWGWEPFVSTLASQGAQGGGSGRYPVLLIGGWYAIGVKESQKRVEGDMC
jgi:hypothetical protein